MAPWLAAMVLMTLLGAGWCSAGAEVADRTIAVVNGHLVTWSDLDLEMRFEALENARALHELTAADRQAAFERLVQARVLRDQMQGLAPATAKQIDRRIQGIRSDWNAMGNKATSDAAWKATLVQYGLSEQELRAMVANQIEILRFTEFEVKPLVRVTRQDVEHYYSNVLVPQLKAHGEKAEPLDSALRHSIRQLIAAQKTNQEMDKWLQTLRSQSTVQLLWDGVH